MREVNVVLYANRLLSVTSAALCVFVLGAPHRAEAQAGRSLFELLDPEGELTVGAEVWGALSTADVRDPRDSYLEAWLLEGRAGESVTVDMISDEFDSYLYVVGPGLGETLNDDDSGGACHARITFTFLENGTFRVIASSTSSQQTGPYVLRVSDTPGPAAGYSCGGMNPALLTDLPTDGRRLALGDVVSGSLSGGSPTIGDGRRAEAWLLGGRAGESVVVTLESDAFDAYLYATGPGLADVLSDDDGAGELNSRLTITFPVDGDYLVVASQLSGGGAGAYTIRVDEPVDLAELPTEGRSIVVGGAVDGYLTQDDPLTPDGRHGQAWALEGRAGEIYVIDLISDDFDAYLYFAGPGLSEPLTDDDGAGDLDSRITVTLPEDGTYRVVASALDASASGKFQLLVNRGEP
ncbi:MAG: PPC domain-containing protein [Gemmatimonadota bacterium]|nr:MAG: PPC domain-containing protein [Gemmatimonadota bacterium]